jgi:large subunit ribosomal protein L28
METVLASSLCASVASQALASRQAQLSGSSLACSSQQSAASAAGPTLVQIRASRRCDLTGKKANNGYKVSFSNHRTKHLQQPNLQYKRLWWEEGKRFVKLRISTKALKTIEKNGLQAMAKKAGINLADY